MLPSTGYFKAINCPFYENGSCERPYCHFKHSRKVEDAASTSSTIVAAASQLVGKPQNTPSAAVAATNPDVLQQLVTEAVKRVLVNQNVSDTEKFSENIVSQVVESLKPTLNSGGLVAASTNNLQHVSQKPTIGKHIGVPILPMTKPAPCVYNPTPIAELKKRHIPIPSYMPTRESKVSIKRKALDNTRSWMSVIRGTSNTNESEMVYKPTIISQTNPMEPDSSVDGYIPTSKFDNIYEDSNSNDYIPKAMRKEFYQPKPKKRREEYVPRKVKVPLKAVQHLEEEAIDELSQQYDIMDEIISKSNASSSVSLNEPSNVMDIESQFSDDDDIQTNEEIMTKEERQNLDDKVNKKTTYLEEKENEDLKESSDSSLKDDIKCKLKTDKIEKNDSAQIKEDLKRTKSSSSETLIREESKRSKDKHRSEHRSDSKKHKDKEREKHKHSSKSSDKERSSRDDREKSKNKDSKSSRSENRSSKEDKRSSKEESRSKENHRESNRESSKESNRESNRESSRESSHRSKKDSRTEKDKDSKTAKQRDLKTEKEKESNSKDSKKSRHKSDKRDKSKSKSSSSDSKSKSSKYKSSEKHDSHTSHKSPSKSLKDLFKDEDDSNSEMSEEKSDIDDQFEEVDINEDLFEMFDSDHDVEEECLRIFQEYKESDHPKDQKSAPSKPEIEDFEEVNKKRVAHPSADLSLTRHVGPSQPPKQIVNPQQRMYDRWRMMKEAAAEKAAMRVAAKRCSSERTSSTESLKSKVTEHSAKRSNHVNQVNGNNRIRIAHVPNAMKLILEKQKILENIAKGEFKTAAQTAKAGPRVAHIPQTVPQLIRPEPLQSSSQKFPLNIRQHYVNIMQDICVQIYTNGEDGAQRALREELACLERCRTLPVYKSSCMLAAHRLKKEIEQSSGESSTSGVGLISHEAVLAGKSKGSWSVLKPKKLVTDFKGVSLYHMLEKWILADQQLKDNGFPRPHPDGPTGRAKLYVTNLRGQSAVSKVPNERYCCRCGQSYMVNKYGMPVVQQNCIYHWARKFTFRGETRYMCCKQFGSATGCCDAKSHVYDHVDVDNLRGYVRTFDRDTPPDEQGIFALDCEMCYTTQGLELTRVTVINDQCNVVYETLVKPDNPVIDYNTRFSGIEESDLKHVTTTIRDVQATLLSMFSSKTILIGHSLESDFKALRILHDTVVDTSVMFPHKNGPPQKRALKNLCSEYLRKIIQNDVSGHDSKEDAIACMELVTWKIKEEAKLQ